ncbi:MAG TPA: hemolysin family protein [Verrucomicrobiae bacterium]|nr:hemolysin family protein [Verrucomicrobiae bacterium]
METAVAAILLFAGASFFFALAETALFSLSNWQVRQLAEKYPRAGKRVSQLLERPDDLLATLALGNTFANAAVIAAALWLILDAQRPFFLTLAVSLALVLIGCEVFPKTLAARRPDRWALRSVWLLALFQNSTRPLHQAAQWLDSLFLRRISRTGPAALPDAEYQELLEMAFQQGTLGESEKEIILQIISLDQKTARDVMRPRAAMACIPDDATLDEMIAAARKFKHRRLPVYDETPDTIVGILNTRALLLDPGMDLSEVIEFPSFVPETMNLLKLFQSLQKQQRGMAVVLDEFGGVAGIVTMEDILVLLVGKIHAAPPVEGFVMEKTGPAQWRVNGSMRLDDFRREYPALGDVPEVETMGGLLTHLLGVVPDNGESATFRNLKLTARAVDDRRVRELMVQRLK